MFQAVALQHLHRSGRLHAHITVNRGPSLKQSEKIPMYKSAASPVILQALRAQPTRKGPGAVQLPAEGSASHNQHSDPGHNVPEIPLLSRVSKVNLGNPHNICYVNSSVLAFVHLTLKDTTHRALRLLRELLLRSRGEALMLITVRVQVNVSWMGFLKSTERRC